MTPLPAHGDALRRILHTEADTLAPAHGLERIRHRNANPSVIDYIHRAFTFLVALPALCARGDRNV